MRAHSRVIALSAMFQKFSVQLVHLIARVDARSALLHVCLSVLTGFSSASHAGDATPLFWNRPLNETCDYSPDSMHCYSNAPAAEAAHAAMTHDCTTRGRVTVSCLGLKKKTDQEFFAMGEWAGQRLGYATCTACDSTGFGYVYWGRVWCGTVGNNFYRWDPQLQECKLGHPLPIPERNTGAPAPGLCTSNPINIATGNKFQHEIDETTAGNVPLRFERFYNSVPVDTSTIHLGMHWRHIYDRRIVVTGIPAVATAWRADGRAVQFYSTPDANPSDDVVPWGADSTLTQESLLELSSGGTSLGWRLVDREGVVETYDATGRLVSITRQDGLTQTLQYSNGRLSSVTDVTSGQTLALTYDATGRIETVTAPTGAVTRYSYDSSGRLWKVQRPDLTPGLDTDNPFREYKYEDSSFTNALTGIVDENGARFATWTYDSQGRALSGEHAGGAERTEIQYNDPNTVRTVRRFVTTDSGAKVLQQTHTIGRFQGVARSSSVTGDACAQCGQSAAVTYDNFGFATSRTDFNDNVTKYKHKANGLEECKVEAFTTGEENSALMRKTTTQWDDTLRLPTAVTVWKRESGTFPDENAACDDPAVNWVQVSLTSNSYLNSRVSSRTETDFTVSPSVSRTTTFTYTASGQIHVVDGPLPGSADYIDYDYDAQGNVAEIERGTGSLTVPFLTIRFPQYDSNGRPLQIVDENNVATTLTYHPRGWLTSRTVDGQQTVFAYDNVGQLERVTLPTGAFLDYEYDAAHRLTDITDNFGNRIHYELDAMGNRTQEQIKDPQSNIKRQVTRIFNSLNQLERLVGGDGQTTGYTYDNNGNLEDTIDPREGMTETGAFPVSPQIFSRNLYDALNRVRDQKDNLDGHTVTTHDVFDNPKTVTDPNGLTTTYTYNGFGEMVLQISPDTGTTVYGYDAAGNRTSVDDARPTAATTYAYDALNRLTTINYPTDTDASFAYDTCLNGKGRLCLMTDESGTTAYEYDPRGNVTKKTVTITGAGSIPFVTMYAYNGADQLTELTYPSGRKVRYVRNSIGNITEVKTTPPPGGGGEVDVVTNVQYQPFGGISAMTFQPGGLVRAIDWDLDGRITDIRYPTKPTLDLGYDYTVAGDVQTVHDAMLGASYWRGYDHNSRLTWADRYDSWPYWNALSYTYDANGNRQQIQNVNGEPYDFHTDTYQYAQGTNQLANVTTPTYPLYQNGATQRDAIGNITSYRNGFHLLAYRDSGRPYQFTNSTYLTTQFLHNARGERVRIDVTSGSQQGSFPDKTLHYDESGKIIAEHRPGGPAYEYLYLDDQPVAYVKHAQTTGGGVATLYHYHVDPLNAPRFGTDSNGTLVWWAPVDADPFFVAGGSAPGLRFPGQYYLPETGLYYNYFRDYDPYTGRYLQSDPIGLEGGVNPYVYALNNPLRYDDPYGLCAGEKCKALPHADIYGKAWGPTGSELAGIGCIYECPGFSNPIYVTYRLSRPLNGRERLPGPTGRPNAIDFCERWAPRVVDDGRSLQYPFGSPVRAKNPDDL